MARVKILQEEIDEIVSVAGKLAGRMNAKFAIDNDRVEIIHSFIPDAQQNQVAGSDEDADTPAKIAD